MVKGCGRNLWYKAPQYRTLWENSPKLQAEGAGTGLLKIYTKLYRAPRTFVAQVTTGATIGQVEGAYSLGINLLPLNNGEGDCSTYGGLCFRALCSCFRLRSPKRRKLCTACRQHTVCPLCLFRADSKLIIGGTIIIHTPEVCAS